jgi:lysophospholipase L1-like esterase
VGGKWGFIDPTGAMVIQPQYDDAWWFSEGLAPVRVGLKWGYVDTKGELKIAPAYDAAFAFSEGLAVVRNGSKDSYIDKKGKAPFPTAYDHAWQFIDGRAQIGDAGKRGLIDRAGKKVWDGPTLPPSPTVETSGEAPPPTAAELAQTPPPIGLIVFEGDSLTIGTRASDPYPSQLMRAWGGGTIWWNVGVGGQGVKDMLADAVKQVDSKYDPARGRNVVVVWGGTNDMALWHRSPQQVFDMLEQYCLDRRAKGFQTIMMTALPRAGRVDTEDYEGRRQDLNALIRAHWSEFSDGLVDVAADPRLGEVGDELDRRYYDSDRVHLNNGGLGVIAELVAPALRTLGTKLNVGHGF